MIRGGFRGRILIATFGVAAVALLLAATLITTSIGGQTRERIERGLVTQATLSAELLSRGGTAGTRQGLQDEARALEHDSGARVSFIAADGRVIADSSQTPASLAGMENHSSRPEIVAARQRGIGVASRSSATLGVEMLYVAAPVRDSEVAFVRLALPLTEIRQQVRAVWRSVLAALALSIAGAFAIAWVSSTLLVKRLDRLARRAARYAAGELPGPAPDYEGDEIGTVAKVLDDAVSRLGERASDLQRDQARLQAILAGMAEGVLVVDASGRVQLVNDAARGMLGLQTAPEGKHYVELIRHPVVTASLDGVRSGRPAAGEAAIFSEGGRTFVARAAAVAADVSPGAVLVLHDVTDLQRADRIRQDFVANVSHELRTPLTAIRGYVEALSDEPVSPEDRRAFLAIIARHTTRMERLARDLLRLALLESGQETPRREPVDVAALFAGVIEDLRTQAAAKRQQVRARVDSRAGTIAADATQLRDALRNLLDNAIIYAPPETAITLDAVADGPDVVLSVSDEGPGIPAGDLPRVFERFYRVDKGRSRESGGTGLGLAIVKHIVERMGGSVTAANGDERGAVFSIRLPADPVNASGQDVQVEP
jgi:two-component system phosphate regulon sensor histidine kinase PhoR